MSQAPANGMRSQLAHLRTEQTDPRYRHIDRLSTEALVTLMNDADATVPVAVRAALPQIAPAIDAIAGRLGRGGRLFYVGSGTPGRIGVLDASECPPTFGTPPERVQGLIAGGPAAITTAQEGVEDDDVAGAADVADRAVGPDDAVVGITASGRTPYVLGAIRAARRLGAVTVGLSCNEDTELSRLVDHPIEIPVGPEVIAGSTRLKAGTAQKLVLNMISTISMVRLGKTHGNLMVDLIATNQKLVARAVRMVQEITGTDPDTAERVLTAAGQHVKTAVVMIEREVDADGARALLVAADGRLAGALQPPAAG